MAEVELIEPDKHNEDSLKHIFVMGVAGKILEREENVITNIELIQASTQFRE